MGLPLIYYPWDHPRAEDSVTFVDGSINQFEPMASCAGKVRKREQACKRLNYHSDKFLAKELVISRICCAATLRDGPCEKPREGLRGHVENSVRHDAQVQLFGAESRQGREAVDFSCLKIFKSHTDLKKAFALRQWPKSPNAFKTIHQSVSAARDTDSPCLFLSLCLYEVVQSEKSETMTFIILIAVLLFTTVRQRS